MSKVTTGQDPDEGTPAWYDRMFQACEVIPGKEEQLLWACENILKKLPRYQTVASRLGFYGTQGDLFAIVVGVIHYKEASGDFSRVLHNGEKIVGTKLKTKLVPKDRGPFETWEDSAVDALTLKVKDKFSDEIGAILGFIERYNGTGYIKGAGKQDTSPYLWACSNINDGTGLYKADGKYDPEAPTDKTVGAGIILKDLYTKNIFKCKTSGDRREDSQPVSQKVFEMISFRQPANQFQKFMLLFFRQYQWGRRNLGGKWQSFIYDDGKSSTMVIWHWVQEFRDYKFTGGTRMSQQEDWG